MKTGRPVTWTREAVLEAMITFHGTTGHWPQASDWFRDDLPHRNTVTRLFGSLQVAVQRAREALMPAGAMDSGPHDVTQATIVAAICAYKDQTGLWPLATAFGNDGFLPSKAATHRLFESCEEAVYAAMRSEGATEPQGMRNQRPAEHLLPLPGRDNHLPAHHLPVLPVALPDPEPMVSGAPGATAHQATPHTAPSLPPGEGAEDILLPPHAEEVPLPGLSSQIAHCGGWHAVTTITTAVCATCGDTVLGTERRAVSFVVQVQAQLGELEHEASLLEGQIATAQQRLAQVRLQRCALEQYLDYESMTETEWNALRNDVGELFEAEEIA